MSTANDRTILDLPEREARFAPKGELERLKDRALHILLHSEYHNNAKMPLGAIF